jgi:Protein of unknown function (DUF1236)
MSTLKSFAIVAALLAGGTSLAIAQNSPQTPSAPGGAAGNPAAPAAKHQCVGIRHGLAECRTIHMSANSEGTSKAGSENGSSAMHGTDTIILSTAQRRAVWKDLSKQATNQNAAGFDATTGTFVPNAVKFEPIPSKVTANIPSLRPYDFAMVNHKLVIVDPSNKVIADVLSK